MENHEIKKKLFEDCVKQQTDIIENLKSLMAEDQESANEYGQPKDRYDSYRMQLLRKRDMYGQQLERALEEQAVLKRIDIYKPISEVGFGAVVITDDQKLFIAVSTGKIVIENEVYHTISIKVPFLSGYKRS